MVDMGNDGYVSNVLHILNYNFTAKLTKIRQKFTIFAVVTCNYMTNDPVQYPIIVIRGKIYDLSRPRVMGIVNLTSDSFFAESRVGGEDELLHRVESMITEGADIIDFGACSTRPGSVSVDEETESLTVGRYLPAVKRRFPDVIISVDTFRARIAEECLEQGYADIINDVSCGADPSMFATVAKYGACYVLTHSRGTPKEMDSLCGYKDVTAEVLSELAFRVDEARSAGICNLIIDPGFGFAKNVEQNMEMLHQLDVFKELGCPVLVGISRKRMARVAGECTVEDALIPTVALNALAMSKGANIIRVHDVRAGVLTAKTIGAVRRQAD